MSKSHIPLIFTSLVRLRTYDHCRHIYEYDQVLGAEQRTVRLANRQRGNRVPVCEDACHGIDENYLQRLYTQCMFMNQITASTVTGGWCSQSGTPLWFKCVINKSVVVSFPDKQNFYQVEYQKFPHVKQLNRSKIDDNHKNPSLFRGTTLHTSKLRTEINYSRNKPLKHTLDEAIKVAYCSGEGRGYSKTIIDSQN